MQSDDKITGNDKASARRLTMNQQAGSKSAVSKAKGRGDTIFIATPRAGEQRGRG